MAVIDRDKCRPKDCGRVCYTFCPMVRTKVYAVHFEAEGKPTIIEPLCTGCGICIKKCPFQALAIVNLPQEIEGECSHRYSENAFKLYRLPVLLASKVTGLLGKNGTGKTTALKILAGEAKPNLGSFKEPPSWEEVVRHFRGSVLQDYFKRIMNRQLKVVHKPQYIDKIPQGMDENVETVLQRADERNKFEHAVSYLELKDLLNRPVKVLSGGEVQRLAIAASVCREADVYIFDEPSSYLDVRQRLNAAKIIRSLASEKKTVVVAEHDIAILDYLSDQVCLIYGEPGIYGVISHPHGVRTGINFYLEGFLPDDNVRFRNEPIQFHTKPPTSLWSADEALVKWMPLKKSYGAFSLKVDGGSVGKGEVIGILGPNGIGKTTFIKILSGLEKPDSGDMQSLTEAPVSYKPQYISVEYDGTVQQFLKEAAAEEFETELYRSEIILPMRLEKLMDRNVNELSGGELQKVTVALCLSRKAKLFLLDEPSAFLDIEERLSVARIIRRKVEGLGAAAIVVEHDVSVQDFIADRLIPFEGIPSEKGCAHQPLDLRKAMNIFLKNLNVTFRRDNSTGRPRVNKENSKVDRFQKEKNEYYYVVE